MARIRTVKPEFWTDERIGECSPTARLLFIACWNFADDYGGLDRSAKQLKAQAFPYDAIEVEPLIQELIKHRLLIEYASGGKNYLHISGFRKHQKVEKPSNPRIPLYDSSVHGRGVVGEPSPTSSGSSLGREWKGREGNVRGSRAREPADVPRETEPEIFDAVMTVRAKYPKAQREDWISAEKHMRRLVEDGDATWAELEAGVERYARLVRATNRLVLNPARFFGDVDRPWRQDWPIPAARAEQRFSANVAAAEEFLRNTEPAAVAS